MSIKFYNEQADKEAVSYQVTPLDSDLWGLSDDVSWGGSVNAMLSQLMKEKPGEYDEDFLDELFEPLSHQMSFYDTVYLAFPHLVSYFEKALEEEDFLYLCCLLSHMGSVLATDVQYNHAGTEQEEYMEESWADEALLENYKASTQQFRRLTKQFLDQHLEEIRQMESDNRQWLATAVLAILDDREAAFILMNCSWDTGEMCCLHCEYYDEETVLGDEEEGAAVTPAQSLTGKWDGSSYEDTYLWFGSFLQEIGLEEELHMLSYYYGTYTCPECGKSSVVMDMMKYFFETDTE